MRELRDAHTALKTCLTAIAVVLCTAGALAQSGASNDVHIGLGVGSVFYRGIPLSVSYDHAIDEQFTVGGYVGLQRSTDRILNILGPRDFEYRATVFTIGPRVTYHPDLAELDIDVEDEWDFYVAAMLGVSFVTDNFDDDLRLVYSPFRNRFRYNFRFGVNYNFTERIGVYGELGYGISILSAGLNVNLN